MKDVMIGKHDDGSVTDAMLFLPWKAALGDLLSNIVVHAVTVLAARSDQRLLIPLVKLLTEPASMKV